MIKKDQYKKATAILNGGIKKSDAQARYLMGILLNHLSYENLIDGTYYSIEPKNTETKNQAVDLLGKAAQQKYTKAYYDLSHFYQYDEKTNPPTYTTWNFPKTPATPVDC